MSKRATDPGFQERFIEAAIRRGPGEPLRVELDVSTAMILVGQLQLALRHPGNTGPSAKLTDEFVRALIDQIATGPNAATLRRGLMAGFDPTQDQAR